MGGVSRSPTPTPPVLEPEPRVQQEEEVEEEVEEEDYDQWMDCESVDVYPVGWCELVGHRLEGPRMKTPPAKKALTKDKKRKSAAGTGTKKVGKIRKKGATCS